MGAGGANSCQLRKRYRLHMWRDVSYPFGMEFPRLPRFQRASAVVPIEITDRDRLIFRLIHRHRFLRSSHLTALVGGSAQPLLRRLQLLYHHGYLERPRAQLDYYLRGGSSPMVYGLGSKGGVLLKQELGSTYRPLRWSEKNRSVGRMFLEHALLISDVLVTLELACRKSGRVRLLIDDDLGSSPFVSRWKVTLDGKVRLGVVPDRVFALEADGERAYFFLEADRGTMPVTRKNLAQTSFARKLLAYEATWSQGIHRGFGFHRFRVLTVTGSESRVQSLVAACAQLQRGHGLFLFAERAVLAHPDILFSPRWQSGRGESASLLP